MNSTAYLFTIAGYIFIQHRIGLYALKLIAVAENTDRAIIEHERRNEISKAWSLFLMAFDTGTPLESYPAYLKGYIYTYKILFFGFPFFAIALPLIFGLQPK